MGMMMLMLAVLSPHVLFTSERHTRPVLGEDFFGFPAIGKVMRMTTD